MQPQWHVLLMLVISRRNLAILPMRFELANTDYVKELCALLAQAKAYELFAFKAWMVCVYRQTTLKTNRGTNGANCKEGLGKGDSMFVYSLGK